MTAIEEMEKVNAMIREEVAEAKKRVPKDEKRGPKGVPVGQIGLLCAAIWALPALCVWMVLPFISKKR